MLTPLAEEESFDDWWNRASNMVNVQVQKGLNSLVVHGAWSHGPYGRTETACVFYGVALSLVEALLLAAEELQFWELAGAQGLSLLTAPVPSE